MASNKVRYGLNKLYWAKITGYDKNDVPIYATPKRLPGAVALTLDKNGDDSYFYADNIKYYKLSNNTGYDGNLEVALIPDDFRTEILGEFYDNNGNLVESSAGSTAEFALLFEFEGNVKKIRHCLLRCTASRPNLEGNTLEEDKEVQTETIPITASPLESGLVKYRSSDDTTSEAFTTWYDKVVMPEYKPGKVTFSPEDGTEISKGDTVTLSCSTPGAEIKYFVSQAASTSGINAYHSTYESPIVASYDTGLWVHAYAVMYDADGNEVKGESTSATYTIKAEAQS